MRRKLVLKLVLAHVGLVLSASCGLLDLASFRGLTFNLPAKNYSFTTMDPQWKQAPDANVWKMLNVSCGPGGQVTNCCEPIPGFPIPDCGKTYPIKCEMNTCALSFNYEIMQRIALAEEVPDLKSVNDSVLSEVKLKTLEIILDNQIGVATPIVDLYVAPDSAQSSSDPAAKKLGSIPSKEDKFKGKIIIPVELDGQQAFSAFATDFKTPFKIFVATTVVVKGGSTLPSGKIDITTGGKVEARF
jgi:hypothetical protein